MIKMHKMIRRICIRTSRHKKNIRVFCIPHRELLVQACMKDSACPHGVVVNTFAVCVAPASSSQEKCHCKKLFPVRCRSPGIFLTVRAYRPCKISCHWPFTHIHKVHSKLPHAVKNILAVLHNAHHHAIRHPFGACVAVSSIHKIAGIANSIKIKTTPRLFKNLCKSIINALFNFGRAVAIV